MAFPMYEELLQLTNHGAPLQTQCELKIEILAQFLV
jgi:hypothetical protein